MLGKIHNRKDLIAMLTWQVDMGIDEALLDYPGSASQQVRMDELLALASRLAVSEACVEPKKAFKLAKLEDKIKEDDPKDELFTPASLTSITSLTDSQIGLAGLDECPLKHTASNLCFADGNPGARVMIIGEVPGRDEDRVGVPFVGDSGQLLDKMLKNFNLDRTLTYLINLLPWRPPGNRSPTSEELTMLKPWLFRHIQLAKPEIILLLGGEPAKFVFNSQDGIMKLRGVWRDMDFGDGVIRPTLASLHPAYLLRSPAQKQFAFEDLVLLADRLKTLDMDNKSS